MTLTEATPIADAIVRLLTPHCDRIAIAGSVRRRKATVGDIEIVCIPSTYRPPDLFSTCDFGETRRSQDWIRAAYQIGRVTKGHPIDGRYIQFDRDGVQVDLFTATAENWGLILAIRTGSAAFSHTVLARGWVRNGYTSEGGMLRRGAETVPVREEADLFRLAGVAWVEPEGRSV
jgi:DNA polymerase/3'-5' exonuclease PolX